MLQKLSEWGGSVNGSRQQGRWSTGANAVLELSERFNERSLFNVAYCAAQFHNTNIRRLSASAYIYRSYTLMGRKIRSEHLRQGKASSAYLDPFLYRICDVWNYLHSLTLRILR